ncbi:MAG TPA: beta-galactosidase [Acidimicrobiales bacterium]
MTWGRSRVSRRSFLQYSAAAIAGGAVLSSFPLEGAAHGALPLPAPTPGPAGLGYPGLPNQAVFGAELQYFRMSASAIPARLALCTQARYNVIQTYVPWNVHESTKGRYDWTGQTSPILPDDHLDEYQLEDPLSELQAGGIDGRFGIAANTDLTGYLEMVRDAGFTMVLRPGPFISDEWANGGLPYWLLNEGDPSMFVDGPDGSSLGPGFPFSPPLSTVTGGSTLYYFSSPSYASDEYMATTQTWLSAFTQFLREGKWLSTQGGPVAAVQVDDESCFFYRFGPFEVDYNPAMLARWDAYSGGQPAPRAWPHPSEGVASLRPSFAWQKFKAGQVSRYLGTLAADLRSAGLDVPINHELEQHMLPPTDLADVARQVILNGEYYDGGDPWNLPVNEINAQSVRAASRQLQPTYATEMSTGDPLLYNILLGEGVLGGLQFTYTEGVADGTLDVIESVGRAFATAGPLLGQGSRRADVAVVWDQTLCRAPFGADRWGFTRDVRRVTERHVPALCTLLIRAGFAFDLVDVEAAQPEDLRRYPTVFLAAADICPAAFQSKLVAYVEDGGRLVTWPAPPTLDENLNPCTILFDALYPEAVAAHDPTDGISITIGSSPTPVPVWLGVDTFTLSPSSTEVAKLGNTPCGYQRRIGSGTAVLLGTWLAADSVSGREGTIVESGPVPGGVDAVTALTQLAAQKLSGSAAALIPDVLPGNAAQDLLLYTFTNERRGGETIASACVGYWDGENAIGVVQVNTDSNEPPIEVPPYHPVLASHIEAVHSLADTLPQVLVNDTHLQARILDGPGGAASVVVANRWPGAIAAKVATRVGGLQYDLPRSGTFTLPGSTGLILPVRYPLGAGRVLVQATAQLLEVDSAPTRLALTFLAPAGGEAVVQLEATPTQVLLGAPVPFSVVGSGPGTSVTIAVALPSGEPTLVCVLP